jgi:hypothetical protein
MFWFKSASSGDEETDMRTIFTALILAGGVASLAAATDLSIENFNGSIRIATGAELAASAVFTPGPMTTREPRITELDGELLIADENRRSGSVQCRRRDGVTQVSMSRGDFHPISAWGTLEVTLPSNGGLTIKGGTFELVSTDLGRVDLTLEGCGDAFLANIEQGAVLRINGPGDLKADAIGGDVTLVINGSGDLRVGDVTGSLKGAINGSGDIEVASVRGEQGDFSVNGSGDFLIGGGRLSTMKASIAGSGDIESEGEVGDLSVTILGSGDVRVGRATGEVKSRRIGSGGVKVTSQ